MVPRAGRGNCVVTFALFFAALGGSTGWGNGCSAGGRRAWLCGTRRRVPRGTAAVHWDPLGAMAAARAVLCRRASLLQADASSPPEWTSVSSMNTRQFMKNHPPSDTLMAARAEVQRIQRSAGFSRFRLSSPGACGKCGCALPLPGFGETGRLCLGLILVVNRQSDDPHIPAASGF